MIETTVLHYENNLKSFNKFSWEGKFPHQLIVIMYNVLKKGFWLAKTKFIVLLLVNTLLWIQTRFVLWQLCQHSTGSEFFQNFKRET